MRHRRRHKRFIRRLETEFTAENKNYRGLSRDLSVSGLFIRTNHAFVPDTLIDIIIQLPDASNVKLKGRVKRAIKTPIVAVRNGMGIEIIQNDQRYIDFIKTVFPKDQNEADYEEPALNTSFQEHVAEPPPAAQQPPEFTIINCPQCGSKNKVTTAKLSLRPKCGKCGYHLTAGA